MSHRNTPFFVLETNATTHAGHPPLYAMCRHHLPSQSTGPGIPYLVGESETAGVSRRRHRPKVTGGGWSALEGCCAHPRRSLYTAGRTLSMGFSSVQGETSEVWPGDATACICSTCGLAKARRRRTINLRGLCSLPLWVITNPGSRKVGVALVSSGQVSPHPPRSVNRRRPAANPVVRIPVFARSLTANVAGQSRRLGRMSGGMVVAAELLGGEGGEEKLADGRNVVRLCVVAGHWASPVGARVADPKVDANGWAVRGWMLSGRSRRSGRCPGWWPCSWLAKTGHRRAFLVVRLYHK